MPLHLSAKKEFTIRKIISSATNGGFGLIGMIIAIAVAALLVGSGLYWKEMRNQKLLLQSGNDAMKKAEELKTKIERQNKSVAFNPNMAGGLCPAGWTWSGPIGSGGCISHIAGWKTYQNDKYGFEVKFPPELKGPASGDVFLGSYYGNSVNVSIRVVPIQDFSLLRGDYFKIMQWRERVLNGLRVKEYFNSEDEFYYVSLPDGNNQIEFFAEVIPAEGGYIEAIISSLKFLR